jgi:hypothetical protein
MDKLELQQTAQDVVDLEARIYNWRGNVTGWIKELSQLREAIENLTRDALGDNDPNEEAFLKCLELITDRCWEHVLKRAHGRDIRNELNEKCFAAGRVANEVDYLTFQEV